MASTNQSPFYKIAEGKYLNEKNPEKKLEYLEEMIKECPKHKSSEKMLSNLKNRYRKLKEGLEKSRKSGKGSKQGIKKSEMQCILLGFPNTGKSSFFKLLTNQDVKISDFGFSTHYPELGTFDYEDVKIQIIDMPPFPNQSQSIVNTTDTILLIIDSLEQIALSQDLLRKANAKKIIIYNKSDLLTEAEKRKIKANLDSKYKNLKSFLFSSINPEEEVIKEIKKTIFETFPIIRIYTKEPKRPTSKIPMILKKDSSVKDVAEKILKGLSSKIKKSKIWGPSSRFGGQSVGTEHILKDKDVVEFQTK